MKMKRRLSGGLVFLLALLVAALVATPIHEAGHCVTVELLGGTCAGMYTWPGFELWPDFGQPAPGAWGMEIAYMVYEPGPGWEADDWQRGLVTLMGSGSNLLLASLALTYLSISKPKGILKILLGAEAFMFLDIVLYTFLPLIGLRHLFLVGGDKPEPLQGALRLGIPQEAFLAAIFGVLILYTYTLARILIPRRAELANSKSQL
jgi:hypothetical protein